MYKDDLVRSLATATKGTKVTVEKILQALMDTVVKTLKKGGEVQLIGFGTFRTYKRKARMGRNPKTGAALKVPARIVAKFVPGSKLKAIK
jgi:nucleoid DNA-binding protein